MDHIERNNGVIREQRLVDGIIPSAESPIDDFTASLFLHPGSEVVFRLDDVPAKAIRLLSANDGIAVETQFHGQDFVEVPLALSGSVGRMGVWSSDSLEQRISALRISLRDKHEMGAVAEILLLAEVPDSLMLRVQEPPSFQRAVDLLLDNQQRIRRLIVLAAVFSLFLIIVVIYRNHSGKLAACALLIAIGGASWLSFGTLHGEGRLLHPWELTHYYLGAKYFPELRYRELYRCLAAVEIQNGRRSVVERAQIRDLDTYRIHPGTWASSAAGACRADFSNERWSSFSNDADSLRRLFKYRHFHSTFRDHGYNATPLNTLLLERVTDQFSPTSRSLRFLAVLDLVLLGAALALTAWAFGPVAGALATLMVGFGYSWEFAWSGGSLGRFVWLAALVAGIACLKKQRFLAGGALVALSGLLRLFPLVLLAGLGWRFARKSIGRRAGREDRMVAIGVVGVLLVGLLLPALEFGATVYTEFFQNSELHASRPPGNDIGFGVLLEAVFPAQSSAISQNGDDKRFLGDTARKTLWALGILAAFLALAEIERRDVSSWELVVWSSPLLFTALPLSGYDYIWLIILAPILARSSIAASLGILLIAFTKVVPELVADVPRQFTAISVLFGLGIVALTTWELLRAPSGPGVPLWPSRNPDGVGDSGVSSDVQ